MSHPVGLSVIGGGGASRADLEAAAVLAAHERNRLATVRSRAEKWLGAITALTSLLGTVLVIKGPDSSKDIATRWRALAAVLVAGALAALILAVYRAYQSAYGDPGRLDELRVQPLTGLDVRLDAARRHASAEAQKHLRHALTLTIIALPLLAAAVAVTWFAPKPKDSSSADHVCIVVAGKTVARLNGDSVAVTTVPNGTEIHPC